MRGLLALACLGLVSSSVGCRERAATADPGAPKEIPFDGMAVDLTPEPETNSMRVEVRVAGHYTRTVSELDIARAWADTRGSASIFKLAVRDGRGEMPTREAEVVAGAKEQGAAENGDARYVLERVPYGDELTITYRARGTDRGESRYALHIAKDRVSAVGHAFLLLPRVDDSIPVRVRWHMGSLDPGAVGACSLGSGNEITSVARSNDLSHAVYAAGKLDFIDGGTGEWMAIVGAKRFEPSSTFLWTSKTLGLVRRALDPHVPGNSTPSPSSSANPVTSTNQTASREPFSFFFIGEPGAGTAHDGAAFDRSFALWFDEDRVFDDRLEIAAAHELIHRVIGTKIRIEDAEGREAVWFSEGFTTHFARKLLFESHRIAEPAFLEDVQRTTADAGASADAWGPGLERSRESYGRGALYAASLDAALRKNGKTAHSLEHFVRLLEARAERESTSTLTVAIFREMVVNELGPSGGDDLDRSLSSAAPPRLPSDAFGPCFKKSEEESKVFELGFDAASIERLPGVVRGLVKGSAADRAGLREGAFVVTAKIPERAREAPNLAKGKVELTISDRRGAQRLRYKPEAKRMLERWRASPCKNGN